MPVHQQHSCLSVSTSTKIGERRVKERRSLQNQLLPSLLISVTDLQIMKQTSELQSCWRKALNHSLLFLTSQFRSSNLNLSSSIQIIVNQLRRFKKRLPSDIDALRISFSIIMLFLLCNYAISVTRTKNLIVMN